MQNELYPPYKLSSPMGEVRRGENFFTNLEESHILANSSPMGEVRRGENLLLSSLSGGGQITGMAAPTPTSDAKDTDKILHPLGGELKRGANVYVCSEPHTPTLSPKGSR